ncbi:MAG: menaquinone-dependent protoporphyrinogen IX dehydrogenase [Woeseiaceae bacterium]|nr:menaquinone-dependent protoporphyrinogen IX dehydrogenase [Woeseiaceae bacterium]
MPNVLLLYSTVDGHTRGICERMAQALEARGAAPVIHELTPAADVDLGIYDAVVIGASIRYGKHRPEVTKYIDRNRSELGSMPAAFFSVNAVARKPEKRTPETNVYVRKFLKKITWEPKLVGIFAGRIDYPSYGPFDRFMIRLIMRITKGPTDVSKSYEFTDWDDVAAFCDAFSAMIDEGPAEPVQMRPGG